ncbi:MAG: ATP-binding protein, partial [Oscillospiraceae bacterium]
NQYSIQSHLIKIFKNIFGLSLISVIITAMLLTSFNYFKFLDEAKKNVRSEAEYIKLAVTGGEKNYDSISKQNRTLSRITFIASDGVVIYDSESDAASMESHADRIEIKKALDVGYGETIRKSDTIGKQTYYFALQINDNLILRVATETQNIMSIVYSEIPFIILIVIFLFVLSMVIAKTQSRKIVEPINRIDLEQPLENTVYDELSPLLLRLERQNAELKYQSKMLDNQKNEFSLITESMSEGLVVLNMEGAVIAINNSALSIFKVDRKDERTNYLSVNRDLQFKTIVETALGGEKAEDIMTLRGRYYSVLANPVFSGEELKGATLLIFDCTEKQQNEKLRREFTANVSHELKTPLTSISGYAEIITAGIAKERDIPGFCEKIQKEASRMLCLIDDILRLSKLDEGIECRKFTDLRIKSLCSDVCASLEDKALKYGIEIHEDCDDLIVNTAREILEEIIYNLCDNSIKYGKSGGYVNVSAKKENDKTVISIADNGMGIEEKYHSRIFERFFRVDKSHSKQIGGTGLGLSIVKHSAEAIGAAIEFKSTENIGTEFRIIL